MRRLVKIYLVPSFVEKELWTVKRLVRPAYVADASCLSISGSCKHLIIIFGSIAVKFSRRVCYLSIFSPFGFINYSFICIYILSIYFFFFFFFIGIRVSLSRQYYETGNYLYNL